MIKDVYFLTVHEPQEYPDAPAPVNGVIVHALTLLHPDLPQPDAGRIYRCLTEFPGRFPGCLIPLSTLNYELDDGRLWPEIADWKPVVRAVIALTRTPRLCESMPLALPSINAALLAVGPFAPVPPGLGIPERSQLLDMLASELPEATGEPPLWPGDNLIAPPEHPAVRETRKNLSGIREGIKAGTRVSGDDLRGLRVLRDRLGPRLQDAIVLYTGEHAYRHDGWIRILPLSELWKWASCHVFLTSAPELLVKPETAQGASAPAHSSAEDHSFSQLVAFLSTEMDKLASEPIRPASQSSLDAQFLHGQ